MHVHVRVIFIANQLIAPQTRAQVASSCAFRDHCNECSVEISLNHGVPSIARIVAQYSAYVVAITYLANLKLKTVRKMQRDYRGYRANCTNGAMTFRASDSII